MNLDDIRLRVRDKLLAAGYRLDAARRAHEKALGGRDKKPPGKVIEIGRGVA